MLIALARTTHLIFHFLSYLLSHLLPSFLSPTLPLIPHSPTYSPLSPLSHLSPNPMPSDVEIEEDHTYTQPVYKVKYRANSISTVESEGRLPVIKVLGTGGTIAAKGSSAFQTAGYHVDLTIEDLISAIPDLSHTCELQFEQVFNLDSKEIGAAELVALQRKVQEAVATYDGVVITHGTDTCEETAFFLDSTIHTSVPVVMCGSMRPLTSVLADGPSNLYQACVVAADRQSRNRGVLVTLNDKIGLGYYISKTDANLLDTFKLLGHGYLGNFVNGEVHYYFPPLRPTGRRVFAVPRGLVLMPLVLVFYAHQDFCDDVIRLAVDSLPVRGIVMATMGAGSLGSHTSTMLGEIADRLHLPVVFSKRSTDGMVPRGLMPSAGASHLVAGGYLNPQKTRLLLQLCLVEQMDMAGIRAVFSGVYGG